MCPRGVSLQQPPSPFLFIRKLQAALYFSSERGGPFSAISAHPWGQSDLGEEVSALSGQRSPAGSALSPSCCLCALHLSGAEDAAPLWGRIRVPLGADGPVMPVTWPSSPSPGDTQSSLWAGLGPGCHVELTPPSARVLSPTPPLSAILSLAFSAAAQGLAPGPPIWVLESAGGVLLLLHPCPL